MLSAIHVFLFGGHNVSETTSREVQAKGGEEEEGAGITTDSCTVESISDGEEHSPEAARRRLLSSARDSIRLEFSANKMDGALDRSKDVGKLSPKFTGPEVLKRGFGTANDGQANTCNEAADTTATTSNKVSLRRSLGLVEGVSIIVGVIIGSGIFISPKGVLLQSGSVGASLLIWALCGLLAMMGALCFAELGTSIPSSGGEYTYIRLAYGPLPAFLYLWATVLVIMPCSSAITALTFANYVLQPFYQNCAPPEEPVRLVAMGLLLILVHLNSVSVKGSIRLQNGSALAKLLALLLIISYGLYYLIAGRAQPALSGVEGALWANTQSNWSLLVQAFYAGYYTYSGW